MSPEFESLDIVDLASTLRRLYGEVRQKNGKPYGKSSLVNLSAGIHRHLTTPPHSAQMNICRDREFQAANNVITGQIRTMRRGSLDTTKHKPAIAPEDMKKKIHMNLKHDNPVDLQMRVFLDIMIHKG